MKVEDTKNSSPISGVLFLRLTCTVYINIVATIILYNSLTLFPHKNISSYINILFSLVPRNVFLLGKNSSILCELFTFSCVYFSVVHYAVKKLSQTRAIK